MCKNVCVRSIVLLAVLVSAAAAGESAEPGRRLRCVLQTAGGDLPFGLEFGPAGADGGATAVVLNGPECIELGGAEFTRDRLRVPFPHYAAQIEATSSDGGRTWSGAWTKTGRGGKETRLAFTASPDPGYRFAPLPAPEEPSVSGDVSGRWLAKFAGDEETTIGQFERAADGAVTGTFLTPGGDYRYLAGSFEYGRLRLSTFDGTHALLFDARLEPDGTLTGGLWAGDSYHDTWTARRDPTAHLPDGFVQTRAKGPADLAALRFLDLDGRERTLAEVVGDGKGVVLEVFGSWCPNCHDASRLLDELQARYADRGLRVVGLAFEYSGDARQDARQIRRFMEHCHTQYPVLYGGLADREEVVRKLPFLEAVKAYPTTIFLRADGTVTGVHTGFSGPATGSEYAAQRAAFERVIEETLGAR